MTLLMAILLIEEYILWKLKIFLDSNSEFLQVKKTYEDYEEDVRLLVVS